MKVLVRLCIQDWILVLKSQVQATYLGLVLTKICIRLLKSRSHRGRWELRKETKNLKLRREPKTSLLQIIMILNIHKLWINLSAGDSELVKEVHYRSVETKLLRCNHITFHLRPLRVKHGTWDSSWRIMVLWVSKASSQALEHTTETTGHKSNRFRNIQWKENTTLKEN